MATTTFTVLLFPEIVRGDAAQMAVSAHSRHGWAGSPQRRGVGMFADNPSTPALVEVRGQPASNQFTPPPTMWVLGQNSGRRALQKIPAEPSFQTYCIFRQILTM